MPPLNFEERRCTLGTPFLALELQSSSSNLGVPNLQGFLSMLGAFWTGIYVSRELEPVVVFTANMPSETADSNLRGIISNYVVPAVINAEN